MKTDLLHLLALSYVPGIGPANQRKILKTFEAQTLWQLSNRDLKEIFKNKTEFIPYFQSTQVLELAQKEIEYCKANGIEIVEAKSNEYPAKLKHCYDAPLILFKKGNYDFNRKLHIALVGTRKMTAYGKKFIDELIADLSNQNIAIVSGLAFGCDIQAHRQCLNHGMPNVAVLAHGLNRVSPVSHRKEAFEIIQNGALISEYSTFHNAEPINFVLRNRIIAGLSDAVIVVESDKRGGALATANYANAYNREVFALPGRIDDRFSLGCNALIQSNQAYMIRNAKDLLQYFNLRLAPKPKQLDLFIELEDDEKVIYEYLKSNGRQQIDRLSIELNMPIFKLNSVLLNMELKGVVKPLSGKFFEIA